eukprot:TRINITY_DN2580_c1_g1_i1.p1 TRINITY_DN2580_c1_g1~~TRINITY_DN2580_c1_g1_i1.p1  ORF type:complete len:535 (-),score=171.64 TRINITY_DN2580_c1_g1_i1:160-1764(-)
MRSLIDGLNNYFENTKPFSLISGTLLTALSTYIAYKVITTPFEELKNSVLKKLLFLAKNAPGTSNIISKEMNKNLDKIREEMHKDLGVDHYLEIPEKSVSKEEIIEMMKKMKENEDKKWKNGKVSGAVYFGEEDLTEFLNKIYCMYSTSNALHPDIWPSLRKYEAEIIRMTIKMLNGNKDCCGVLTSGGTESILMAIKAARDYGFKEKGISHPEMVVPVTAHAAFEKGASYFKVKLVSIPVGEDFKVDLRKMKNAINRNTVLLVGSAPNYPHGIIDDIGAIAKMAKENKTLCHVDGCLGGFILPWIQKVKGNKIPPFDFAVDGVTSISADSHKYGYSQKGNSVLVFSDKKYRKHMFFTTTDWPGGLYCSPSVSGSRPGGLIAVTWAVMLFMGKERYLEIATKIYETAQTIKEGVTKIDGIKLMGDPLGFVIAFTASDYNIFSVSDTMAKKGWSLNPIHRPNGVHLCCTNKTVGKEDLFLKDLKESVEIVKNDPLLSKQGNAPVYGLASSFPDRGMIQDLLVGYLDILLETPEDK